MNPQRITSPIIGSRNTQTTYYWTKEQDQIVCGCYSGTLEQFKMRVTETHGDNKFAEQYNKWIQAVELYKNAIA